ncbi:hypothetical protein QWJ34_06075 [Saccharibacillus sp. CPCC 101409]|uniref:hypothetical protein n=1 Tax=Saccharibacillus sp. CPCC 101409 TaxID=3058041 RepID=UPI002671B5DD|nr:hypothetical protein [Saccharibacillus sp. CPCC 101409]MDO3409323.1 hypothetical protein [Saccharibacillus sp. CPCC 101409]
MRRPGEEARRWLRIRVLCLAASILLLGLAGCGKLSQTVYKAESNEWRAQLKVSDKQPDRIDLRIEYIGVPAGTFNYFEYGLTSPDGSESFTGTEQGFSSAGFKLERGIIASHDFLAGSEEGVELEINANGRKETLHLTAR